MLRCRACLKSFKNMVPFDENYTMYFNILTNLNLQLCTHDPQQLCKRCFKTFQHFIEFREKCITANAAFSDIILQKDIKQENTLNALAIKAKEEMTLEDDNHEVGIDDYFGELYDEINYDNNSYELVCNKEGAEEKKYAIKDMKNIEKNSISTNITSKTTFACGLCVNTFEDNIQLNSHLLTHRGCTSCPVCTEKFTDWQEVMAHRLKHLPVMQHQCNLCTLKYKSVYNMEHHLRTSHHTAGERQMLRCRLCNRNLKTPKRLRLHYIDTHNSLNKQFYCDYCNKLCVTKATLKKHIASHADITSARKLHCDQCDYVCRFSSNLWSHKLYKHNSQRAYCGKCKKSFVSGEAKDRHECTAADVICPVCGKIFSKHVLSRHVRTHDKERWHACERCPARFKWRQSLAVHRDKHNGVRRHACDVCPARFYFPSVLAKHRRVHTGEKPYVCKVCQKAFTGNNNLKVHMKVHGKFLIKKKNEDQGGALLLHYESVAKVW